VETKIGRVEVVIGLYLVLTGDFKLACPHEAGNQFLAGLDVDRGFEFGKRRCGLHGHAVAPDLRPRGA
jgi:hypothetical protein